MKRVLVVGAGCTGACAAVQLRKALGNKVSIDVWEKARGAGGRMTTTREEVNGETVRADVGAQYLSVDMADSVSEELITILLKNGTVAEVDPALLSATPERTWGCSWKHFAGTDGGVNSALKSLIEEARATPHYERRVASIDKQGEKWKVRPFDGKTELFDAVLVATPGCGWGNDNLNKIHGGWEGLITPDCSQRLQAPQHDHRFAVALFLAPEYKEHCEKFFGPSAIEKSIDDDMVHLLAYQTRKTALAGGLATAAPAIVAHTTHDYSKKNRSAGGRDRWFLEEVADRVLHQYLKLPPSVRVNRALAGSKVITWKQCQVTKSIQGESGLKCQPLGSTPALVLAGDYFTHSSFSGCAASAADAAQAVAAMLEGKLVTSLKSATAGQKKPEQIATVGDDGAAEVRGGKSGSSAVRESNSDSTTASEVQKERMKLKKKLREIEKLEAQEAPLQANQLEKIKLKSGLIEQLEALGPEESTEPAAVGNEEIKGNPEAPQEAGKGHDTGKGKGAGKGKGYPADSISKKSKGSGKSKGDDYASQPFAAA